ncbi:DNA alkylation repair protein [Hoeflea prorocentri]|uniref:DNA alkylation repair protein n=1 Tax=Hoeflea prorocentri TaxID=1922333 RepID=A0A9X3UGC0_9HYPH|nr:DNA alkylation repair protein [Hoeflea prorocentri]MCY6380273.1 DNA alkylation repair protein [Hoeflea prorocentri]MDA5398073.1 DNA alkylation repair protein [Hoeflea prorocentri]
MAGREPAPDWDCQQVVDWLHAHAVADEKEGMARFGIDTSKALGIRNAELRPLARKIKRNHDRALALWKTGIREARLLACFSDDPKEVTADQARNWAKEFNSWEVVDHAAGLFIEARLHDALIAPFAADEREFVRRTAFAMIAWGAVHLKKEPDSKIAAWLTLIEEHATDERNFVKKAVNWALRQIGKRSMELHGPALDLARKLEARPDPTPRWIGRDAVKELTSQKTLDRLAAKAEKAKTAGR